MTRSAFQLVAMRFAQNAKCCCLSRLQLNSSIEIYCWTVCEISCVCYDFTVHRRFA